MSQYAEGQLQRSRRLQSVAAAPTILTFHGVIEDSFSRVSAVHSAVAYGTKRDQVFLRIGTRVTTGFLVVYFESGHGATGLAPPIITM
jgi:hypothetical protein